MLKLASMFVDSAVSKTCNVGDDVTYDEFKDLYYQAWLGGCKGITTFRASGKRYGILNEANDNEPEDKAEACFIDPETGQKDVRLGSPPFALGPLRWPDFFFVQKLPQRTAGSSKSQPAALV